MCNPAIRSCAKYRPRAGSKGIADFQSPRRELRKEHSDKLTYYVFDLLWLNGKDLRGLPLVERARKMTIEQVRFVG
jgi:ATP-dependent DNA ligase